MSQNSDKAVILSSLEEKWSTNIFNHERKDRRAYAYYRYITFIITIDNYISCSKMKRLILFVIKTTYTLYVSLSKVHSSSSNGLAHVIRVFYVNTIFRAEFRFKPITPRFETSKSTDVPFQSINVCSSTQRKKQKSPKPHYTCFCP